MYRVTCRSVKYVGHRCVDEKNKPCSQLRNCVPEIGDVDEKNTKLNGITVSPVLSIRTKARAARQE